MLFFSVLVFGVLVVGVLSVAVGLTLETHLTSFRPTRARHLKTILVYLPFLLKIHEEN